MILVKATDGMVQQYPYSVGLLRKDNPNTSFPKKVSEEDLAAFNAYPVTEVTPAVTDTQKLVKTWTPTLVDGKWVLAHEAVDLSEEDIASLLVEAKTLKIAEIDAKTAADIIEIVGDATSQRNLLAGYLNAKSTDGVVTTYELQWKEVEALRASGNNREALVADALDIEEVEAI